jgi:hypothetical protein
MCGNFYICKKAKVCIDNIYKKSFLFLKSLNFKSLKMYRTEFYFVLKFISMPSVYAV